jgi:MAD (mothers against decapentaplegic) interacting protein
MFSDGIRPGGDLTELDGSSESRLPYRRPGRVLKRVGTPPGEQNDQVLNICFFNYCYIGSAKLTA